MKTLIFGAGPIGQWIALNLHNANKDVTLLARGDNYQKISNRGIEIFDGYTNEKRRADIKVTAEFNDDDNYDLIVVAMSKSSRIEVCKDLAKNSQLTNVLFLGNDVSGFHQYFEHLPRECILLGFPGAGGGYDGDRLIIADSDKPNGKKSAIYIGEINNKVSERLKDIKKFFESAGQPVSIENNIDGWLKYHFAFIAPTAGVAFRNELNLKQASEDKAGLRKYVLACREAGNVLRKAGYKKRQPPIFNLYYYLPEFIAPKIFKKLFASRFAEVAIGMHAKAIGSEFQEMIDEFKVLQKSTLSETPNLNYFLEYIPKS